VDAAERSVVDARTSLDQAGAAFCIEAKDYIVAIDRYGKLVDDRTATVGDVTTLGADLGQPRESTTQAADRVVDAHDALNDANAELAEARTELRRAKASASGNGTANAASPPPSSSPAVRSASIERVRAAESDLQAASNAINAETPLSQATETFTSAAFALEIAWIALFEEAGCLSNKQSNEAAEMLEGYTSALQSELKTAGYLNGPADGIYGPATADAVESLQRDAGLPVTGLVDRGTRAALDDAVAATGRSAEQQEVIEATSVQTTLRLAGYWPGPIDGTWTPELEDALRQMQRDLGLEPTGTLDAATQAALEDRLVAIDHGGATSTPSSS
jgi:murein L,D-transpeptidase YcbB/YkuD